MPRMEKSVNLVLVIVFMLAFGTPIFALGITWLDTAFLGIGGSLCIYQLLAPIHYPMRDPTAGHGIGMTMIVALVAFPTGLAFYGLIFLDAVYYFSGNPNYFSPDYFSFSSWDTVVNNPLLLTVACIEAFAGLMFAILIVITLPKRVRNYEVVSGKRIEERFLALQGTQYLLPLLVTLLGAVLSIPLWMHVNFASLPQSAQNIIGGLIVIGAILFLVGLIWLIAEKDNNFRGFKDSSSSMRDREKRSSERLSVKKASLLSTSAPMAGPIGSSKPSLNPFPRVSVYQCPFCGASSHEIEVKTVYVDAKGREYNFLWSPSARKRYKCTCYRLSYMGTLHSWNVDEQI